MNTDHTWSACSGQQLQLHFKKRKRKILQRNMIYSAVNKFMIGLNSQVFREIIQDSPIKQRLPVPLPTGSLREPPKDSGLSPSSQLCDVISLGCGLDCGIFKRCHLKVTLTCSLVWEPLIQNLSISAAELKPRIAVTAAGHTGCVGVSGVPHPTPSGITSGFPPFWFFLSDPSPPSRIPP